MLLTGLPGVYSSSLELELPELELEEEEEEELEDDFFFDTRLSLYAFIAWNDKI